MNTHYLFVYGTLRKAFTSGMHHLLAPHGEFVGHGRIRGQLYDVGGYPGAVESRRPDAGVFGEIYRLANPRRLLAELDQYEKCGPHFSPPYEYQRKVLPVRTSGRRLDAWVYVYNRRVTHLRPIEGGDYLSYLHAGRGGIR